MKSGALRGVNILADTEKITPGRCAFIPTNFGPPIIIENGVNCEAKDADKRVSPSKDTIMTDSIMDAFTCKQCGAQYDSEKELGEHQKGAHHGASPDCNPHETSEKESGKAEDVNQHDKAKTKNA